MTGIAMVFGKKIQKPSFRLSDVKREAWESFLAIWGYSCLQSWPYTLYSVGEESGYKDTLQETVDTWQQNFQLLGINYKIHPLMFISVYVIALVLIADTWTYWKHRALHTRLLFAFHQPHHTFRNPTCFAGFGVAPMETLLTFWMITSLCSPRIAVWTPLHNFILFAFLVENLYLHCGYTVPLFEKLCSFFFVNTSGFHNVHHSRTITHFGEVLTFWDWARGTSDWYVNKHDIKQVTTTRGPTLDKVE